MWLVRKMENGNWESKQTRRLGLGANDRNWRSLVSVYKVAKMTLEKKFDITRALDIIEPIHRQVTKDLGR